MSKRAANIVVRTPADRGYGFIINIECMRRWTRIFYDDAFGPEVLASMTPEEADRKINSVLGAMYDRLPLMVYKHFPRITHLRHRLVLMSGAQGRWLLVLKDNSSQAALSTKIAPEDVEGVRTLIGLGDQIPMWYRIPSW